MASTTENHRTIDMLDSIQDPEERFRVLAMFVKDLERSFRHLKNDCPSAQGTIKTSIQHLEYILRGANGDHGGLIGQMEKFSKNLEDMQTKQELLEDKFTKFNTEFKVTMAKAAILMSAAMVVLIPVLGKFIDKILP